MKQTKKLMVLFSIVQPDTGKKLIKELKNRGINMHFQFVGYGTAPTEMMDIFGLGSNDKDIILSMASKKAINSLMANFGNSFSSYTKYGGLLIVLNVLAVNRLVAEVLNHDLPEEISLQEEAVMKNEHKHYLVMITVNRGYTDSVMEVAKKAGATGGTVIKGRLAESEKLNAITEMELDEERESIIILAPADVSARILEDVNEKYGLRSKARGILCAVPVEKAYKI
jgi:hypothetical protein